jgi:hypothetical protein
METFFVICAVFVGNNCLSRVPVPVKQLFAPT